jgi:hypothetical protein
MDLTRRGLIARAVAGGGALLLRPSLAFAGPEGEAVFSMRIPHVKAGTADSARARWVSPVVDAGRRFELLGIARAGASDLGIQVRAKTADGRWSPWLDLPAAHGHGPDGSRARLSDPAWTGPARLFQLRAAAPLGGAKVVLVDSGTPARAAAAPFFVDAGLQAGPGQPDIIARSTWATSACAPRRPALLGQVQLVFVHHTVSSNSYRASQSAGMVRAICLFHKYGNGWNEIGYNFVVDRFGQIFEGRKGGIDEPIVGAQAGGYNVYSSGVALLGTFSGAAPSRAAFDALAELVAWKLAIHGLAVPGRTTVQVTSTGAPYSRYRAGSRVSLDRVSGHRDADLTSCPGNVMYRRLPRLRQVVSTLAPSVSSLSATPVPAPPHSIALAGVLTADGLPIADGVIELQRRTARGPRTIATTTTAADGSWTAAGPAEENASLRAVYRGDVFRSAVVSPPVTAGVAPLITLAADTQQVAPGGVVQFSGTVEPLKPRLTIVISQQLLDGSFAESRTIRFGPADDGTFARTIGFPAAGQYQVVVLTDADDVNGPGASPIVAVTVA